MTKPKNYHTTNILVGWNDPHLEANIFLDGPAEFKAEYKLPDSIPDPGVRTTAHLKLKPKHLSCAKCGQVPKYPTLIVNGVCISEKACLKRQHENEIVDVMYRSHDDEKV